jgi:hypothetical protein
VGGQEPAKVTKPIEMMLAVIEVSHMCDNASDEEYEFDHPDRII